MDDHVLKLRPPGEDVLERLSKAVGVGRALRGPDQIAPYLRESRGRYTGRAAMVVRPRTTLEVSRILAIANEARVGVVPQGGNTGLVGGQIPSSSGHEIILDVTGLDRIRDVDKANGSITVEAGVTLQGVQEAAAASGRLFPLSLASEGSCRIGGNLATNAGGVGVIAYGNTRELCLGLEVVLADGRIWDGLRRLRKDNTGYDLKDIFIGSEGTLGIITAAVMKLFPAPTDKATAFVAIERPAAALDLLQAAREISAGQVTAIEILPRLGIEFTMTHAGTRDPLGAPSPWYVLLELSGQGAPGTLQPVMETILSRGFESGFLADAAIAKSGQQARDFWRLRETMSEVQRLEGGSIKHDVSVPVSMSAQFIDEAIAACLDMIPDARPLAFGHIGDGNIHFNLSQPIGADKTAFLDRWDEVNAAVHEIAVRLNGSISAEHGIGQMKRDMMSDIKSPVELGMMQDLKRLFDPHGILNPGKVLPPNP